MVALMGNRPNLGGGGLVAQILKYLPILESFIAFLFITIALTAGHKPNYIENVHVISFNMSTLGQNVIPTPTIGPSGGGSPNCGGGFLDTICSAGESAAGAVVSAAASVESLAAGAITKQLGIRQYYSLHLTDVCQGDFQPGPTDKNAKPDIASCTKPFDTGDTDILGILNQELDVGPLKIDLSKLGFTQDLENAFQLIPRVLAVTGYFFLLASLLTGLLMVCTAAVAFLGDGSMERALVLTLLAVSSLSWLMTFMGAIVLTIGEEKVRKEVNDKGNGIGIFASSGSAFFFLVWMAAILTTSVLVTSVIRFRSRGSGSGGGVGAAPDPVSDMEAQKQQPYGMGDDGGHDGQYPIIQGNYPAPRSSSSPSSLDGGYAPHPSPPPQYQQQPRDYERSSSIRTGGHPADDMSHHDHHDASAFDDQFIERYYSGEESATSEHFPHRPNSVHMSPTRPRDFVNEH